MQLVYSCTTLEVLSDPRYIAFLKQFGEHVHHWVDTRETNQQVNVRSYSYQLTLRHQMTCASLFPLAKQLNYKPTPEYLQKVKDHLGLQHVTFVTPGMLFNLMPKNQMQGLRLEDCVYNVHEGPFA